MSLVSKITYASLDITSSIAKGLKKRKRSFEGQNV